MVGGSNTWFLTAGEGRTAQEVGSQEVAWAFGGPPGGERRCRHFARDPEKSAGAKGEVPPVEAVVVRRGRLSSSRDRGATFRVSGDLQGLSSFFKSATSNFKQLHFGLNAVKAACILN